MAQSYKEIIEKLETTVHVPPAHRNYDLSPFLTAPAVQVVAAASSNTPVIVPIPKCDHPSPFAENISPDQVKLLHDFLCGTANGNDGIQRRRGKEIFLSWKRAWDLNNNYFIEGRESPVWIAKEYVKLKKEFEDARAAKRTQDLNKNIRRPSRIPVSTTGPFMRAFGLKAPSNRPGREWKPTGFRGKVVRKTGQQAPFDGTRIALVQILDPNAGKIVVTVDKAAIEKTYHAGEDVPVLKEMVPNYQTTVEYISIAAPAISPPIESYHTLRSARVLSNNANIGKKKAFLQTKQAARAAGQPHPPVEDFRSTITKPLDESGVEDKKVIIKEVIMTRPTGDLELASVETDGDFKVKLSYGLLQRTRKGSQQIDDPLNEDEPRPHVKVPMLRWKDTSTRLFLDSRNSGCVARYPIAHTQIEINSTTTLMTRDPAYLQASSGEMVDKIVVDEIPEWQEVNMPNPNRIVRSYPHAVHTTSSKRRPQKKASFNRGNNIFYSDSNNNTNSTSNRSPSQRPTQFPAMTAIATAAASTGAAKPLPLPISSPPRLDDPRFMYPEFVDPGPAGLSNFGFATNNALSSDSDSDSDPGTIRSRRRTTSDDYLDDRDAEIPYPPPEDVEDKVTHEGGGFFPMSYLADYALPDPCPDDWVDALQNTVWRPRRTGEKKLQIDMDEDFDTFAPDPRLEVFGGVDCGRSPYPVFRSVAKYYEFPDQNAAKPIIVKKKVWDQVTGTVFNMPSKPVEEDLAIDDRSAHMQKLYGDKFRDNRNELNKEIFPLDIRRVTRLDTVAVKRVVPKGYKAANEVELYFPWSNAAKYRDTFRDTDPWWVTPEQEKLRDVPMRSYPAAENQSATDNDGNIIHTDDTLWNQERQNEDNEMSQYFVTNLHGGTLIINGVEVKKGHVAGPLPAFAIIECPGEQVAFWHGVGGRFQGEGRPGARYSARWDMLRQIPGLEHVAMTAGQVWNVRIKDRLRRELTGNRLEDDEDWARWKAAVEPLAQPPCTPGAFPPLRQYLMNYDVGAGKLTVSLCPEEPKYFCTEEDELRWIHTRAKVLVLSARTALRDSTFRPLGVPLYKLNPDDADEIFPEHRLQIKADTDWSTNRTQILQDQRKATQEYKRKQTQSKDDADDANEVASAKRKRDMDEIFAQALKKVRTPDKTARETATDRAAMIQSKIDARIWKEHLAREAAKATKQAADDKFTDAMFDAEQDAELDRLETLYKKNNPSGNPFLESPRSKARNDQVRLKNVLIPRQQQMEEERDRRIQKRRDERDAEAKDLEKYLKDIEDKKIANEAKRKTDEVALSPRDFRLRKRAKLYNKAAPELFRAGKEALLLQQQKENDERVKSQNLGVTLNFARRTKAMVQPQPVTSPRAKYTPVQLSSQVSQPGKSSVIMGSGGTVPISPPSPSMGASLRSFPPISTTTYDSQKPLDVNGQPMSREHWEAIVNDGGIPSDYFPEKHPKPYPVDPFEWIYSPIRPPAVNGQSKISFNKTPMGRVQFERYVKLQQNPWEGCPYPYNGPALTITQEDLDKMTEREQLAYVLDNNLVHDSRAPQCSTHSYIEQKRFDDAVDISEIIKPHLTVIDYLNARRAHLDREHAAATPSGSPQKHRPQVQDQAEWSRITTNVRNQIEQFFKVQYKLFRRTDQNNTTEDAYMRKRLEEAQHRMPNDPATSLHEPIPPNMKARQVRERFTNHVLDVAESKIPTLKPRDIVPFLLVEIYDLDNKLDVIGQGIVVSANTIEV